MSLAHATASEDMRLKQISALQRTIATSSLQLTKMQAEHARLQAEHGRAVTAATDAERRLSKLRKELMTKKELMTASDRRMSKLEKDLMKKKELTSSQVGNQAVHREAAQNCTKLKAEHGIAVTAAQLDGVGA